MLSNKQSDQLEVIRKMWNDRKKWLSSPKRLDGDVEWITVKGTHIPLKDGKAVGGPNDVKKAINNGRKGKNRTTPSVKSFSERMENAFNYKANGKDYGEVGKEMRTVLADMPVGSKVTVRDTEYTKTEDGEFKYLFRGKYVPQSANYIANQVNPFDKKTMPKFESPKTDTVAKETVKSGEQVLSDTSVDVNGFKSKSFKGEMVDIDEKQYETLRAELQKNSGKACSNKELDGYLDAIDSFRGTNYIDVVAASAGFGGPYEEYSRHISESAKKEAKARSQKMEEFIANADKYDGTVMRAMGFDIGGEYDNGASDTLSSLLSQCKQGNRINMGHLSSWTNQEYTVKQVLSYRTGYDETAEESVELVFTCKKSKSGVDIGQYSRTLTQGEVVFSKNQDFIVKKVKESRGRSGNKRYDIEVEEA